MKKILMFLVICLTGISLHAGEKFKKGDIPKKMVIISQSSQSEKTTITAVDSNNDELVLLILDGSFYDCYRTGITIDMSKQKAIEGTSSSDDE